MSILETIQDGLTTKGLDARIAAVGSRAIAISLIIVLGVVGNWVAKRFIVAGLRRIIARTKTKIDDAFVERKIFEKLSHVVPGLVIYGLAPFALEGYDGLTLLVKNAALVYLLAVGVLVVDSFLNAVLDVYQTFEVSKEIPIQGFLQLLKLVIYFLAVILFISLVLNKTPVYLISGLGAMTAVLMLIFKDAILGLVAGIQLTANKMVARGDWIEMPKYGADGDVVQITLTTVKVQNWDKTITSVPTYALIIGSFKNWRGMSESGGRRIKRAVYIDINTIRLCSEQMLTRFAKIQYISEYIAQKQQEVSNFNQTQEVDDSVLVNGRRLTNVGTFRAYIISYLKNHPMINQEMTFLVRQLAPTEHGLPIEIYVFCKDKVWANYEAIQADIFDHILAVAREFDLQVFQTPSGSDFQKLTPSVGTGTS